jgi:hypothetical protein
MNTQNPFVESGNSPPRPHKSNSSLFKAKGPNPCEHRGDGTTAIFLERPDGTQHECLIWTRDYEKVQKYHWNVRWSPRSTTFYAYTQAQAGSRQSLPMHRLLLPDGRTMDHRNHNGLDNRIYDSLLDIGNLRVATYAENSGNARKWRRPTSSKFKGVSWNRRCQKWIAYIKPGKPIHLGLFVREDDAARAYDVAALEYFGEFACLNFPTVSEPITAVYDGETTFGK